MTTTTPTPPTVADIEEALRDVIDPELGINIVDLGLVYGVHIEPDNNAIIDMTLTSAACPLTDVIEDQTAQCLDGLVNGFRINWVWMPPWGPEKITADGRERSRARVPARCRAASQRPRTRGAGCCPAGVAAPVVRPALRSRTRWPASCRARRR